MLIYFNSQPTDLKKQQKRTPGAFIRCCRVRYSNGIIEAKLSNTEKVLNWIPISEINGKTWVWWSLQLMQDMFPLIKQKKSDSSLLKAIDALKGIIAAPVEENETTKSDYDDLLEISKVRLLSQYEKSKLRSLILEKQVQI